MPTSPELLDSAGRLLAQWTAPRLFPVINATGVVLHTNLGRAPLSRSAIQAMQDVSLGYSNLEFDLRKGQRGSRLVHAEALLKRLTGAEAALVVNNNAAAVLLALTALARRRAVVIGRTQLVEIGGGFRIPDVMKQSGARLVEVGTTNRVHLSDYASCHCRELPGADPARPPIQLPHHRLHHRARPGRAGRSWLTSTACPWWTTWAPACCWIPPATAWPTSRPSANRWQPAPTWSASPATSCWAARRRASSWAGQSWSPRLKKHPLARAIRADKLCLAALSATLLHYLKDEAESEIPIWRMIAASPAELRQRAQGWAAALGQGEVLASRSAVGGGSLPEETLPTFVLALDVQVTQSPAGAAAPGNPPGHCPAGS